MREISTSAKITEAPKLETISKLVYLQIAAEMNPKKLLKSFHSSAR